jgi:hypothetical protein
MKIVDYTNGLCCGRIYREDIPVLAQAREGPTGARRRKEQQPLKMESVALQFWKVLHPKVGRCRIRNQIKGDYEVSIRDKIDLLES